MKHQLKWIACAQAIAAPLLVSTPAEAQDPLYTLGVDEAGDLDDFARSVADAGDVDGDGVSDFIVGAPFANQGSSTPGMAFVYSGADGRLLWSRHGEFDGDTFGWSVDGVGDLNGDGRSEVIVGAPLYDLGGVLQSAIGRAYLFDVSSNALLFTVGSNQANDQMGSVVRGLGDLSGDGVPEFAVCAPNWDFGAGQDFGLIVIYDGASQQPMFGKFGYGPGNRFGSSITTLKATGDPSTSRLLVGEPGFDGAGVDRGLFKIFDGTGMLISTTEGLIDEGWLGGSVARMGDLDGDGVSEFAVSEPFWSHAQVGSYAGRVSVYSGTTLGVLYRVEGTLAGANFGLALDSIEDRDGDGRNELVVGAPNHDSPLVDCGLVGVFSGADGSILEAHTGGLHDHLGRSVRRAGDLNGGGAADFIAGATDAPNGQGRAYVYLAGLEAPETYCTAKLNSQGCLPTISWEGVPSASVGEELRLGVTDVLGNQPGLLIWSRAAAASPFHGGTLCVGQGIVRTRIQNSGGSGPPGCAGSFEFVFSHAYMAQFGLTGGDVLHAQYWYRDPGDPFGVGLSDAVRAHVVP